MARPRETVHEILGAPTKVRAIGRDFSVTKPIGRRLRGPDRGSTASSAIENPPDPGLNDSAFLRKKAIHETISEFQE